MSERPATGPRLIQCVGNRMRSDDGVGPAAAELLRAADLPPDVEIQEHWGEGSELMQDWPGAEQVILIDAACSGSPSGTTHFIDASRERVPAGLCYYSTHRFGVAEAVEVARALGQLPGKLHLYAIEGEDFKFGEELSPRVADSAKALVAKLLGELS